MRACTWLVLTGLLAISAQSWAVDEPDLGDPTAETPAQALEKASPEDRPPRFLNFSGGLFRVMQPEDEIYEPVPVASAEEFYRRGYEIYYDDHIEFVVDRAGQIYEDRPYAGVIPGVRDVRDPDEFERKRKEPWVLWVGFQPMAALSRVFWLLSEEVPTFQVKRVSPTRLEVFFPRAKVPNENTIREMFMEPFTGPIRAVVGHRVRGGIRYVITLKHAAHYLYRYEAPFLLLDLEVDAEAF